MKKRFFVKITASLALLCMLLPFFSFGAITAGGDIFKSNIPKTPDMSGVGAAYVYNMENSREIVAYNANSKIYPSSLTKIVAFALVSDKLASRLDEKITVTQDMLVGTVGTHVGIAVGEIFTVKELMYIAFCGCFNDAVNVLAYVCSGSVSAFVSEMNAYATKLGAKNTVFTNPTGVHNNGMYTTMSDLAIMITDAVKDPLVLSVTNTVKIELEKGEDHDRYMLYNRNMLLSDRTTTKYLNEYATGLNAGSTVEGGECVATLAEKEGLSYLCIVTGGKEVVDENEKKYITSYKLINELISWSFDSFGYVKLFDPSLPCADIDVKYAADITTVSVIPNEEIIMYLPLSFDTKEQLDFRMKFVKSEFEAPLKKGDTVGKMTVIYAGDPIGEVELVLTADAQKDEFLYTLDRIKTFSQNRVFILTVICVIGYTLLFTMAAAILRRMGGGKKNKKKKNKNKKKR